MSQKSDQELMELYRQGEMEAFHELYRRHAPQVFGYIQKKISNRAFAEELLQEVFLKVHVHRSRYDPIFPFLPWLFSITRNAIIDLYRSQRKETGMMEPLGDGELIAAPATAFQSYLEGLSERERQVVTMHFEEGRSFGEIAHWLRISPANARKLSSRAIQKLKTFWK